MRFDTTNAKEISTNPGFFCRQFGQLRWWSAHINDVELVFLTGGVLYTVERSGNQEDAWPPMYRSSPKHVYEHASRALRRDERKQSAYTQRKGYGDIYRSGRGLHTPGSSGNAIKRCHSAHECAHAAVTQLQLIQV